jgi:hypothetical protein
MPYTEKWWLLVFVTYLGGEVYGQMLWDSSLTCWILGHKGSILVAAHPLTRQEYQIIFKEWGGSEGPCL